MPRLSVVITTFDNASREGAAYRRCLASAAPADELLVVDGGSRDATPRLAREAGARLLVRANPPMLNRNKNAGFEAASGDWLLSLDADEEISPALWRSIRRAIADDACDGFWLRRRHLLLGQPLRFGPWGPDRQLRLFRAGRGRFACVDIHELLELDGVAGELEGELLHHRPHAARHYRRRILHYSRHRAARYLAAGRPLSPLRLLGGPPRALLDALLLRGGLLDGPAGLALASALALESLCDHLYHWRARLFGASPWPPSAP